MSDREITYQKLIELMNALPDNAPKDIKEWAPKEAHLWVGQFGLGNPEMVVPSSAFDGWFLEDVHREHPMPRQRSGRWKGVYLFFSGDTKDMPIEPLYAGQSSCLPNRIRQHISGQAGSNWLKRLWPKGQPLSVVEIWVAVWLIHDRAERVAAEHRLIANAIPKMNRG